MFRASCGSWESKIGCEERLKHSYRYAIIECVVRSSRVVAPPPAAACAHLSSRQCPPRYCSSPQLIGQLSSELYRIGSPTGRSNNY
ncbi:unnamed protein product [Gongylonema pulchrum]|uniref:Uncharacterized protein n=1 Tax=Gongylonema pulchrum TaxID=637853 RepID=A0A183CU60_9BILA|nr:unnamed protein product [Gongylonema pulchrum]